MHRSLSLRGLFLVAVAGMVTGCALMEKVQDLVRAPTPTPSVVRTQGHICDAITGLPVSGAQLRAGTATALTDVVGEFSIQSFAGEWIQVTAPRYETAQILPRPDFPVVVDLVPDPAATFDIIYDCEKRHEFGRQYDLLHPDAQALFAREQYIHYMEQNRPYDIVDFSVGDPGAPTSGAVLGKVYTHVVQVPVQATVRVDGQPERRAWVGYAVQADGLWRWFRGPFVWMTPTAMLTLTPSPTLTHSPSPAATHTVQPTYTPYPTATPSPTQPGPPPATVTPERSERILFTSDRDGNREVYVMNADGTGSQNLTQHPAQDGDASWAPLRDRLAFVSDRDGNSDIFVMNADGSGVTRLTSSPSDQIHPAWSPNGALIAYVSNEDGDWEIYVMNANGSGVLQATRNGAWDSYPTWSPDSAKLAFTSDRDGNYELYLLDLATLTETRLSNHPASDAFPAWSPGGDEIAFTSGREGQLDLYLIELATEPQHVVRLSYTDPGLAVNRFPSWSADGMWLAFTSWRDGNAEIYVMRRGGWGLRNLTNHPADDEAPAWGD